MLSVLSRGLKIQFPVSPLGKTNVLINRAYRSRRNEILRVTNGISSDESWRRFLKIIKGKNASSTLSSNNVYTEGHERRLETLYGRRATPLGRSPPAPLEFTLATIRDTWILSKAIRPSTGCLAPFARKFSYSCAIARAGKIGDGKSRYRGDVRRFASEDGSCKKNRSKPDCPEPVKEFDPEDQCTKCPPSNLALSGTPKITGPCVDPVPCPCVDPAPAPCADSISVPCCAAAAKTERSKKYCSANIWDCCSPIDTSQEKLWQCLSLFIGIPAVLIYSLVYWTHLKHKKCQPRQEFVEYPYLRIMRKPFPWGDGKHSLFHNPEKNPISPHGYEAPDPCESKTGECKD
nr:uncharacterized protein LOC117217927 [Megalopta genalis]